MSSIPLAASTLQLLDGAIVVDGGGVDIRHLLVEVALARADIANTLQQLSEVAAATIFQALVIEREASSHVLFQNLSRPLSEANAFKRLDAIADGNDYIEAIQGNRLV